MYAKDKTPSVYRQKELLFKPRFEQLKKNVHKRVPLSKDASDLIVHVPPQMDSPHSQLVSQTNEFDLTQLEKKLHNSNLHCNPPTQWKIYQFNKIPGLFFIKNVFTEDHARFWVKKYLEEYAQPPNKTNLFTQHGFIPNLWKESLNDEEKRQKYLSKMTWCTLGYQYDWTPRKYIEKNIAPFPKDMALLCQSLAMATGVEEYSPEAAIINFYHSSMTMGGHRDDAELCMDKPIVSISFGSSAIYLLGGETRDVDPIPIQIDDRDVMILGGEARGWYHGIARLKEDSCPEYWNPSKLKQEDAHWKPFCEYMYGESRRINANVRQVFPKDYVFVDNEEVQ